MNITYFILIFLLPLAFATEVLLSNYLNNLENGLAAIASNIVSSFSSRCSSPCNPSYDSCSTILPALICDPRISIDSCQCYQIGRKLNASTTTVKLADVFSTIDRTDKRVKEMICSTEFLASKFQAFDTQYPGIKWQFFGSYNGIMRNYPGRDRCAQYDPRLRPWYVEATTGAKNIILIMDISGSMNDYSKIQTAKDAATNVINTLSYSDFVGLVPFSTNATKFLPNLIRMSSSNKQNITNYINSLSAGGTTNYEDAFRKTYEIYNSSYGDEMGNFACQTIILFLTDGVPTIGMTQADQLIDLINFYENQTNANMTVLSWGLGQDAQSDILLKISCARYGIYHYVLDFSSLGASMTEYYLFISAGVKRTNSIMTEPFLDANGAGNVTSMAFPVYDDSVDPPFILGVVGFDLLLSDLLNFTDYNGVLKELAFRNSKSCLKPVLSNCSLESVRENKCYNVSINDSSCKIITKNASICANIDFSNVFFEGSQILTSNDINSQYGCCGNVTSSCQETTNINQSNINIGSINNGTVTDEGLSSGAKAGIIIGCIFGVLLLIVLTCLMIKALRSHHESRALKQYNIPVPQAQPIEHKNNRALNNNFHNYQNNAALYNPVYQRPPENIRAPSDFLANSGINPDIIQQINKN